MTIDATRREMLQAGAAGGVALWIAASPAIALAESAPVGAGAPYLRRSMYVAGMGLVADGVALHVDAVEDLVDATHRGLVGNDDAFALQLSGDAATPLVAATHAVQVPGAGAGELFLAPVGIPGDRQLYEIVVDRSVRLQGMEPPSLEPAGAPVEAAPDTSHDHASAATGATKPDPRYAFLRRVSVRRGRPGLQAKVRVARSARLKRVRVQVMRDNVVLAYGAADVRGNAALVGLRMRAPLKRGYRYDIVVTGVDRNGVRTVVRRSGIVR
ncbi:MAG: hypothetical protein QOF76_4248 [Solirubrobacteraceae bacterium]|nr:hypothetical protein [Solirubrobacteraceae bacterium]